MFVRSVGVLLFICFIAGSGFAQARVNVVVDTDLRVFTTMAALNAAGFDVELASQYHPVRAAVREWANDLDPDLLRRLRQFYESNMGEMPHEAQLAQYISLAVMLNGPPDLRPGVREESLPPDARRVIRFSDLLREFFEQARVTQRWGGLRAQYEAEIERMAPLWRDTIQRTDAYLRTPGGSGSRLLHIYMELAAPVNSVTLQNDQDDYYVVVGASTSGNTADVRHAYLHYHLDALAARQLPNVAQRTALLDLIAGQADLRPDYRRDLTLMTVESLIRAVELRLDSASLSGERAQELTREAYRSGLILTPYFTEALAQYETGEAGFQESLVGIFAGIDVARERERFQTTFHTIPLPETRTAGAAVPAPPPSDPVFDLLKEAESAFNAGDGARARTAFTRVLDEYDAANGSALYGLALIASREGDAVEARRYFERAIASSSTAVSMKAWSHVYLGRILDLECQRPAALEQYRRAVELGDGAGSARPAAQEGVEQAFGGGCA